MKISDFHYDFSDDSIALEPARPASSAQLLSFDRKSKKIEHKQFQDLADLLRPDDCLVVNNTKVIPARFFCSEAHRCGP